MTLYQLLKTSYRQLLPGTVRTFFWRSRLTRRLREGMIRRAERLATNDELHGKDYFKKVVDPMAASSAPAIVESIIHELRPATVVDVGCGSGQILMNFRQRHVSGRWLEYADAGLEMCRARGLDVRKFDLERDTSCDWKSDVVVSTEVAEHSPERCADRYVDLQCSIFSAVIITAAAPGQTGTDHVNERPPTYWIEKFGQRSFIFQETVSVTWRKEWAAKGVAEFYC